MQADTGKRFLQELGVVIFVFVLVVYAAFMKCFVDPVANLFKKKKK